LAASHDRTAGFIPAYIRSEPFLAIAFMKTSGGRDIRLYGIRRSLWQALGALTKCSSRFPFKSSEEIDFTIRALMAGYFVYETPNVVFSIMDFALGTRPVLIQGYLYGIGPCL